jgi:hypothetical protein
VASRRTENQKPRRRFLPAIAVGTTLALLGGLAVFAQGYDAQEVLPLETAVWVARDSGQYARVNTDLAEIDTVRQVEEPSGVAQAGAQSVVFGQGFRQLWPVDAANPIDLDTGSAASAEPAAAVDDTTDETAEDDSESGPQNTPLGTRQVVSSGEYLAYLTDTGSVFVSGFTAADGGAPVAFPVNPFASVVADKGEEPPTYSASAVAVSPDGTVVSYSPDEKAVRRFDAVSSDFVGDAVEVANAPAEDATLEMALVGETWVLSAPADGLVWIEGLDKPVKTGMDDDAVLQSSSATGTEVYLADSSSLVSIDLGTGEATKRRDASGTPAAPLVVGDVAYAAWLSAAGGTMWSSEPDAATDLELDGDALDTVQTITPVLQGNGQRAVLVERESGMLWTVPDGRLVPLSQWDVSEDDEKAGTIQVDDVAQQEPPVAVADSFGVRSGQLVSLPLLLNDHDPNKKDVLSIVPAGIALGLADTSFGDLGLVSNNQAASVLVRATSGSTTFSYSVTDGSAESALVSVTLTVIGDETNSAPVWCGVDACQQDWPTPQISPGGTVTIPVLSAWVDPDGDSIILSDARKNSVSDPVSIVPTADGKVAIRHNDPNASDATIAITIVVSDSRGVTAEKELLVSVSSSPALVAEPVALVAGVGEKAAIAIGDHVTGGSGSYRVVDAVETASTASGLVVVPNAAAGTIELAASAVGEYLVNYTVQDSTTLAEQSAVLRLTAVADDAPIAVPPLTAIVRANEDTTVDVLGAVQNTTGRVLVITGATSSTPALSVSVVGQSSVRVSGTTESGQPGPVGTATITISDGNNAVIEGQVTVFLVPETTATSPIAVPDSVSVRAGAQVDIPVLDNDLSPRGERLLMHPDVEGSGTAGELVFAGETNVRYLAPAEAGVYTLRYTIYLEGQPDRIDTAPITVTVLAAGANRAPQPRVLSARAIAGQTVQIPVDMYGVDPDGDSVVLADVELPAAGLGVSSVSADGTSVVYAAPANGVSGGQVSFAYTVRDAQGEKGIGVVRVGVVSSEFADATPITYSDYIRVQRGSTTPVVVQPMLDDRDPTQGTLELVSVIPNAPSGTDNTEYARLQGLISPQTSLADGVVALAAGSVVGTQSYVYTVRSTKSSSTSQGLIVVDVTDGEAPDAPIVTDTVITAKDRARLAKGVDVVSGKVQWATGTVADLELSVWGASADRFTVAGSTISGEAPADGALVPFTLTGKNSSGDTIEAHGFLRIPAFDDMRIQVRGAVDAVRVDEEKSVEFEVRDLLDLDASAAVEIRSDSGFIVQRGNASCAAASAGKALYKAGREAPWTDTCTVPVRLDGQSSWTLISVPVEITPSNPRAVLGSISRTIAPGTTESLDLYANATTWEGGREGDRSLLDYSTQFAGSAFIVTQSGDSVSIEARADARSGTREAIEVSVSNFGGLASTVTLIVGVAPVDAPRGATFTQQCDATTSASCAITVVGLPGEYDPFAGKPGAGLKLVKVGTGATVSCPVATVAVSSATQVVASWPGARPAGGLCPVPITVQDAQGRTGTGLLTIDVLSFPQAPLSVTTVAYSGTSVTLSVPLGDAAQAHPSVTGVVLLEGGAPVPNANCGPGGPGSYSCVVSGLVNGERHIYTARAVNSVGQSVDTTPVETWAYSAPVVTNLTATSVYDPARTAPNAGVVNVAITAAADTVLFKVTSTNQTYPRTGDVTEISFTLPPGTHPVDVIPVSQFQPPIGAPNQDGAMRSVSVTAVGTPSYPSSGTAAGTPTSITLNGSTFERNSSPVADEKFVAWRVSDGAPSCVMSGNTVVINGGISSPNRTIPVPSDDNYYIKACGTNGYGLAQSEPQFADSYPLPTAPTGDLTYTVGITPVVSAPGVREYVLQKGPTPAPKNKHDVVYTRGGQTSTDFNTLLTLDVAPPISASYCRDRFVIGYTCELSSSVDPTTAPTIVRVDFPLTCRSVAESKSPGNPGWVSQAARNNATITPVVSADGLVVTYTVTFTGNYRSLQPAVSDPMCITPDPIVVVPTPVPTPTETPTDPNNPVIPIP